MKDCTMLAQCPSCYGAKKIMGLGMIVRECEKCNGVGYFKLDESIVENSKVEVPPNTFHSDVVPKKRGRPKRNG